MSNRGVEHVPYSYCDDDSHARIYLLRQGSGGQAYMGRPSVCKRCYVMICDEEMKPGSLCVRELGHEGDHRKWEYHTPERVQDSKGWLQLLRWWWRGGR